jgi:4-amino-4-deoxy-L-arabinose transferase-like glycosyltransferase
MSVTLTPRQERLLWLLLALAVGVRLVTLGAYPLLDPSEARYAEIARKMLETGDWLVPQFDYGVPFWGKPPLSFWLTAASMRVFGVNEFAARLPSLVLMAACGTLVWRMAHARAGRGAALLATAAFATMGLAFVAAGAVLTDIALTLGTTLSMVGFWAAVRGPDAGRRVGNAMFFAGLAIGLLAKGPIGVVLTALPIAGWMMWQREWRDVWNRVSWVIGGLATVAAVIPWYFAAERATPGFLEYFIVGEHWQRFTQPGWTGDRYGAGHQWRRGWIWLFWFAAAVPWSFVMLDWLVRCAWAPRPRLRARVADPLWRYLAAWALAPILFFTLSRNILLSYVLPGLPAFALLLMYGPFASEPARPLDRAETRGLVAAALLAVGFLVAIVALHERIEREYTQRALVRAFEAQRQDAGQRLVYLGDVPVSADFYSGGQARHATDGAKFTSYLADGPRDFFAMRDRDAARLSAEQRAQLAAIGRFGEFVLYRELPAAPPAR